MSNKKLSRRAIIQGLGTGLAVMAGGRTLGTPTSRGISSAPVIAKPATGAPLTDPTTKFPKPPFNGQSQEWPGLCSKMDPIPDHGEKTYRGSGRLQGRKALITGGDSGMGRAAAIAYAREGADVAVNQTKAATMNYIKSLAKQLGPKGIRVNGVAPGPIWTALQVSGGASQEKLMLFGGQTPLGRPGQPAELASIYVQLDAVKHMSIDFLTEWLDFMRTLEPGLFAVGEYWAPEDRPIMQKFLEAMGGRIALFDAPLHNNFFIASNKGKEYDLTSILKGSILEVSPQLSVTLVDNHDTQPLQTLEAPVEAWFKPIAYALILLREAGYPCVFYPDLYGAHYVGKGKDGSDQEIWLEKCQHLDKLVAARKEYAYGKQRDYFDAPNCIGWTREGAEDRPESGCVVILSNGEEASKRMELGSAQANRTYIDHLAVRTETVIIGPDGWAEFPVSAGTLSVWRPK